ncbi:MAG TPA: porin [Afifellaceae bacterium]|nr:porin [Afifellaceae bacterium]
MPARTRNVSRRRRRGSLLSGPSTAILVVAAAGGEAAELPIAEPENVLACSTTGYLRVPGTDLCLRVGGDVYSDRSVGVGREVSFTTGYEQDGSPTAEYRTLGIRDIFNSMSAYGTIRLRTLTDTDQGTLFTALSLRGTSSDGFELKEAYLQWAGLTAGFRYSFFDFGTGYNETAGLSSDRDTILYAYTFNVTPNLSVTASAEDAVFRRFEDGVWAQYAGQKIPDLVAAIDYEPERGWLHGAIAMHYLDDLRGGSEEVGWAAILGGMRRFRYGEDSSGRFLITGAVAKGALDYLGIPLNAPDYIREDSGELRLSTGVSGLVSYEHYWSPKVRSAVTISAYRTKTDTEALQWNSEGFWVTLGSEYIPVPGLTLGLDVTYYEDEVRGEEDDEGEPANAKSVVTYGFVRRAF